MKYLVNRETKEHRVYRNITDYIDDSWYIVEADAEGWIKWNGGECPLPDDCLCHYKMVNGSWPRNGGAARCLRWDRTGGEGDIIAYRPILDKPESDDIAEEAGMTASENYENQCRRLGFDPETANPDYVRDVRLRTLLTELTAAHEAAQSIPDLLAELREALKPMGLGVMYLSEFDAAEPEAPAEAPQEWLRYPPMNTKFNADRAKGSDSYHISWLSVADKPEPTDDMSDWRNWREGDLLECIFPHAPEIHAGAVYRLSAFVDRMGWIKVAESNTHTHQSFFRFHSRPERARCAQ